MVSPAFKHRVTVEPSKLKIEPFLETQRVRNFDCGNDDLNNFLNTEEVERYERENYGRTYCVYYQEDLVDLVAYFTISHYSLRIEYLKLVKSFSLSQETRLDIIPAQMIGRLAVATEYQNRGIGRLLIKYIIGMALANPSAVRLLVLKAKIDSIGFYEKCGFELTHETSSEKKRRERYRNRTMFLNLLGDVESVAR